MSFNLNGQLNQVGNLQGQVPRPNYAVVSCDEPNFEGIPIPKGVPKNLGSFVGPVSNVAPNIQSRGTINTTQATSPTPVAPAQGRITTTTTTTINQSNQNLEVGSIIRVPRVSSLQSAAIPKSMPKDLGNVFSNQMSQALSVTPVQTQPTYTGVQSRATTVSQAPTAVSHPVGLNPVPITGNIVSTIGNNIQSVHHEVSRPIHGDVKVPQQVSVSAGEGALEEIISQVYLVLIGMAKLDIKMLSFPNILSASQQAEVQEITRDFNMKKMVTFSYLMDRVGSRATIEGGIQRRIQQEVSNYQVLDAYQKLLVDGVQRLLHLSFNEVTIINHNQLSDDICELTCEIVLNNLGMMSNPLRGIAFLELEVANKLNQLSSLQATRESMNSYILQKICNVVHCALISLHVNGASPMLLQLFVEDKTSKKVLFDLTLNNIIFKFFGI